MKVDTMRPAHPFAFGYSSPSNPPPFVLRRRVRQNFGLLASVEISE